MSSGSVSNSGGMDFKSIASNYDALFTVKGMAKADKGWLGRAMCCINSSYKNELQAKVDNNKCKLVQSLQSGNKGLTLSGLKEVASTLNPDIFNPKGPHTEGSTPSQTEASSGAMQDYRLSESSPEGIHKANVEAFDTLGEQIKRVGDFKSAIRSGGAKKLEPFLKDT